MKTLKRIIFIILLASCGIFSTTGYASNYVVDAEKYFAKGKYKAAIIQVKNHLIEKPKDANARHLLGKIYLKIGDIKQANKEISMAYQLNPGSESITLAHAQILLIQKNYNDVNKVLEKKFSDANKENQRLIYVAYAYVGQNKLADAKQIFSELSHQSENVQVYNGLAKISFLEKEMGVANQWLDKSFKLEPENFDALQIKASIEIADKNLDEALAIYTDLIKKQENNLALYLTRAAIRIQIGDLQGAEKDIIKVTDELENLPKANYMMAQIKLQEKKFKEAQDAAQKVLNFLPRHYNAMLILGISNYAQGNFNQADKYLTQYLSANPGNIEVQNILANVYLSQKKGEQAILLLEYIEQEKRNKNANILMTLGSAYILTGEHQKGINILNKAKALQPDSEVIQKRLIAGHFKTGDIDSVITGLEKIVSSEKGNQKTNYLLVVSYIQKKELKKAEHKLKTLIQNDPEDPELYNLVAILEKLKGNNQKVQEAFKHAIELNEQYIPAHMGLAELALSQKNWVLAKGYYSKVIQINQQYVKANVYLAAIAEQQNNLQEVEKQLKTGLKQAKGYIQTEVLLANILSKWYLKQKTPEKIMSVAQELTRQYPNNNLALSFLSHAQIVNNENEQAEKTLRIIIRNDNLDTKHRLILADLLAKKKNMEESVLKLLDEVIFIIPENPKPVILKINYLLTHKKYQQVINVADYAEKQFPQQAVGKQAKADVYRFEKKWDKALHYYQEAYQLEPNNKLLFIISEILIVQGKDNEALMLLRDGLKNKKTDIFIHFKLAIYYEKHNQLDLAIPQYKKMLEIRSDNVLALNNLAWIYLKKNNAEAVVLAKKAYENAPESALVIDTYGYILTKEGRLDEGIALIEKAVKLAPKAYDIQFHLAEAYYYSGEIRKTKRILETILTPEKVFSEKQSANRLLNMLK